MAKGKKQKARVMIGIPHTYWIAAHTTRSLVELFYNTTKASIVSLEMIGGSYHHTARNGLTHTMLKSPQDFTHLLFIDSDIDFRPDSLDKLLEHDDKDIVGALVFQKSPPFPACSLMFIDETYCPKHDVVHSNYMRHMRPDEIRGPGLLEVASVGYGFTLFKREVFDRVPYPWFSLPANEDTATAGMWEISMVGEDVYFAQKAHKSGVKMYLDRDIKCGHFGAMMYSYDNWDLFDKMYAPKPKVLKKLQADRDRLVKNKEVCIIGLDPPVESNTMEVSENGSSGNGQSVREKSRKT